VAVAVCAPAEEEASKLKRQVLAYPGALAAPGVLAAPLGWNGAYPYATTGAWNGAAFPYAGAWNGAYPYGGALNGLNYPYAGLPARVAAPWAPAVAPLAPAVAPVVAARPAYLG